MKRFFISGYNYIQDIVLQPGTYTFWAYIKSEFGDKYTFALANEADEWEVFDVDVQQGLWTKAYIIFTITEKKVKLNLIKRYFDPSHPVYVLNPQIIKGNIPSDAGASPFDIDQITDDLHDEITSISDFTNDEFADKVLSAGERVSLKRDLETVEVIFQSLKGSFDKLIINPFISADVINDLIIKYNEVASAKTVLFGVINGIIDGDGVISQDEIDSKNEKLDALNNAIYEYNMAEKEIANSMGEDYTQKIDEAIVKATYWSVKSSSPVIYKNASDASTSGSHVPITVSGELRSGTTTTQGGFITVTPNGGIEPSTATASPVTISPSDGDAKTSYTVRLYDTASKTTLLDTMTIPVVFKGASGVNAINVILSNEADVLPASPEGVVSDYSGSDTTIRVFEGATELDYDGVGTANGKFNVTATSTGITVGTKSESGLMCVFGNASNMTLDNASITFIITGKTQSGDSFSVTKTQSFAKARTGSDGVSVTLVDVEFAKNTSATTPPTTGWSTTAPTLSEGEQLWTRTKTTYSSGSPTYTTPANITPKKGDVGTGVESVTEEYAISTSKTVQPTTGWSTTQPAWVQGQYIWSRVKVVYKNPTSTVYTGYAVSSEWEAVNNLQIGGRNLVKNSSFNGGNHWIGNAEIDSEVKFSNNNTLKFQEIDTADRVYKQIPADSQYKAKQGDTFTLSFYVMTNDVENMSSIWLEKQPDSGYEGIASLRIPEGTKNGDWVKMSVTYTINGDSTKAGLYIAKLNGTTPAFWISDIKIEKGTKATDWTPAPEDVEADILKAEGYMKFRYLRDWIQGSSVDNNNIWKGIKVIDKNGFNLAFNKPVTSNGTFNASYPASNIVDNNLTTYAQIDGTSPATLNYVQVDLLQVINNVDYVQIHHYHDDGRTFNSTKTEISEDGVNWTTIFDSAKSWTYKETIYGNTISFRTQNLEATILRSGALADRFSGFDGGLATAVIMEMREPSTTTRGDATAGLSGIKGDESNLPAFWAGGTYQNALDGVAKAIIKHDGSGHVAKGNLWWNIMGELFLGKHFSDKTIMISPDAVIPTLTEIQNKENFVIDDYYEQYYVDLNDTAQSPYTRRYTHNIEEFKLSNSGKFPSFYVDLEVIYSVDALITDLDIYFYLEKKNSEGEWDTIILYTKDNISHNGTDCYSIIFDRSNMLFTSGTYRIRSGIYYEATSQGPNAHIVTRFLTYIERHLSVKKLVIGNNGICFSDSDSDNFFRLSLQDSFPLRYVGASDIPGVLLAGEVISSGGFTSSWGAKKHASSTAVKIATGQYRVYHSIGHTDYQIQITPTSANRTSYILGKGTDNFVVYFYSVGSSPSLADTGFHFMITGRNY